MARRSQPALPVRAELTTDEKRKAIRRFEGLMEKFEAFDPAAIQGSRDPKIVELAAAARSALEKTYPQGTTQYEQLLRLTAVEYSFSIYAGGGTPVHEIHEGLQTAKSDCLVLLRQAIADLKEDIDDDVAAPHGPAKPAADARAAFIVHGHDEGPREAVARFLSNLGITPIILHEQANKGRTIIEKFEQHGDVPFAVVLLTPDDVGGTSADMLRPRARQNVILELGYFIGRLGRARVCALKKGDLEQPSDILGVAYVNYDDHAPWRQELAREIEAAGIEVDWNKVMKR
jgi:predicted nucleotide-binding protein